MNPYIPLDTFSISTQRVIHWENAITAQLAGVLCMKTYE